MEESLDADLRSLKYLWPVEGVKNRNTTCCWESRFSEVGGEFRGDIQLQVKLPQVNSSHAALNKHA